jgi:hypothetical protein
MSWQALESDAPELAREGRARFESSRPRERFEVYEVEISEAVLVAWDAEFNKMRSRSWAPRAGARENVRSYP